MKIKDYRRLEEGPNFLPWFGLFHYLVLVKIIIIKSVNAEKHVAKDVLQRLDPHSRQIYPYFFRFKGRLWLPPVPYRLERKGLHSSFRIYSLTHATFHSQSPIEPYLPAPYPFYKTYEQYMVQLRWFSRLDWGTGCITVWVVWPCSWMISPICTLMRLVGKGNRGSIGFYWGGRSIVRRKRASSTFWISW